VANPYPANFETLDGARRLTGQVNFTNPANQPGGGGSSPVLTANVPISSADLIALLGSGKPGVELVAAPAAGSCVMPIAGAWQYLPGSTPYSSEPTNIRISSVSGPSSFTWMFSGGGAFTTGLTALTQAFTMDTDSDTTATIDGAALKLVASGLDFADGNGTVLVHVLYSIIALT